MISAYTDFWKRSFDFEGRSTRSQYWYPFLWFFIIGFCVEFLGGVLEGFFEFFDFYIPSVTVSITNDLFLLFVLANIIPHIAVSVRRLRDAGYGWGWFFIRFVPIGGVIFLVLVCQPSKENSWAYNVKEVKLVEEESMEEAPKKKTYPSPLIDMKKK